MKVCERCNREVCHTIRVEVESPRYSDEVEIIEVCMKCVDDLDPQEWATGIDGEPIPI